MKYFTFFLQKGWLLNNRDGELEYDESAPGCLTVRRGNAGMRLFCLADNIRSDGFLHGCVHGACHPQPDRPGEGAPGSGILCRFREEAPAAGTRTVLHAIAADDYGPAPAGSCTAKAASHAHSPPPAPAGAWAPRIRTGSLWRMSPRRSVSSSSTSTTDGVYHKAGIL